jgi:acetyl-CoA carboxylase biotin carboxyl carrier protein
MLKDKIKTLIEVIENTSINELEVSSFWGAQKIRLKKAFDRNIETQVIEKTASTIQPTEVKQELTPEAAKPVKEKPSTKPEQENVESKKVEGTEIIAPLVGTFYESPKPGSPPFVKVGDRVEVGQVICIIEAMKIFNEIEAEISGEILEIGISDGSPVEYGQPLMIIKEK